MFCRIKYENQLIDSALKCLERRMQYKSSYRVQDSQDAENYLKLQLAKEKEEVFAVMFLNIQNQLISFEKLFRGSIRNASVPVGPILRRVIENNCAAVILSHNHPSGDVLPSDSDILITKKIQQVLKHIDVSVLDHIIVSHDRCHSMTDSGNLLPN